MATILETNGLKKNYLSKPALRDITLRLDSGRILGLMGPNGSGKTTFMKIIAGLQKPSGGTFAVCGETAGVKTKGLVSFLPDRNALYS